MDAQSVGEPETNSLHRAFLLHLSPIAAVALTGAQENLEAAQLNNMTAINWEMWEPCGF